MTTKAHRSPITDTLLNDLVEQWFPLLPRNKPICQPLTNRIERVHHLAQRSSQHTDDSLLRAAEAHNLAALILSDCAMPTSARDLCRRQFDIFATAGPYHQATAKLTLQPLINLGRLHTRDGNGTAAYEIHEALLNAAKSHTHCRIDGRTIAFQKIVHAGDDHREIIRWLWSILLADGIRALCRAGRWSEALHRAEQHNGIGQRLFDGRQVAILAHCATGNHAEAIRLIDETTTPTPWEEAVAACMKVLCLTLARQPCETAIPAMVDTYLALHPAPEHAVFQARLGLTVAALAGEGDNTQAVIRKLERCALDSGDAYAARDLLTNPTRLPLTEAAAFALNENVRSAGLEAEIPPPQMESLTRSVRASESTLTQALTAEYTTH